MSTVSSESRVASAFSAARSEDRALLIGYLPAGYPSVTDSIDIMLAMIDNGVDLIEVGLPYSDPLMDGPVIQDAVSMALELGATTDSVLEVVSAITAHGGTSVVMSYWNPIERYGVDRFAHQLSARGGSGLITPDLTIEEAQPWLDSAASYGLDPIFLVAPSSTDQRIAAIAGHTRGFIYAASTMGVTGARDQVSSMAPELVARVRQHTDLPVAVGLGVSTGDQAAAISGYADGVIVGSAFVRAAQSGGAAAVGELAADLARGVRKGSH
ncbi:MAG: tryptophan synthase subunit alpha [Candidatus Nanopelagicales bacterium]|nr:tryptophan synthase subunit alpha [Candidatus Nanopelagicales bacterium]MCF8539156.1 tryptophan synthase subunit alpha [Candidatus Nanopelagicales bacterium]MCF8550489.1 tryptophan synthase subunit alpha [Candidatus Nanopelagicales bacterium]